MSKTALVVSAQPHQPEMCNFKPRIFLNIDEIWDLKRKTFEILAAVEELA